MAGMYNPSVGSVVELELAAIAKTGDDGAAWVGDATGGAALFFFDFFGVLTAKELAGVETTALEADEQAVGTTCSGTCGGTGAALATVALTATGDSMGAINSYTSGFSEANLPANQKAAVSAIEPPS